jgi:hypothetical protein
MQLKLYHTQHLHTAPIPVATTLTSVQANAIIFLGGQTSVVRNREAARSDWISNYLINMSEDLVAKFT